MTQPAAVRVVVSPLRSDEYIAACRRPLFGAYGTTFASKGETTHYDLRVASLLQIMFAVHPGGSVSHDSQVAVAPLRIVFPYHPAVRGHNKAP